MKQKIRIGCGAGFSGDRIEPAIVLSEKGNLDYLVLECLAERTIALAQKRKLQDPSKGYDPLLVRRITSLLPILVKNKICLITNMGAANPVEASKKVSEIAQQLGLKVKVAAVSGDDVFDKIDKNALAIETNEPLTTSGELISANAYLGVEGILEALKNDANIIITGRVADPSLFLAPIIHEFNWATDNYDLMGKGTVIGHLMEYAGHITGGYFADPIKKPVENMDILGHPFVDVFQDGSAIISKIDGTGGMVNLQTAKEQLLYEVINPYEYFTPNVIADFTTVKLQEIAKNQVQVSGGTGKQRPNTYKVSVGYKAFFLGEGEISYAGLGAFERAELAGKTLEKRLKNQFDDFRVDYIGLNAVHRQSIDTISIPKTIPEIRLRVAGKAKTIDDATSIGEEVEALYTNGPAGGGGVRKYVNEVI
ncbi:acyclic terpene utilization AtuA family protein [Arcicella sp. DC2W]|uniref:Acyclic terpene utilization AtuA family protein n=1 Tax=Arcicella gelida TaxID=2984195 RepID=A0ABU5S4H1_9BACT|nr:acyclic terpene utilization AtuA family protein [Arcicella sp. DC2W]MEA5403286.1 acyclic terpene utilization AtuA family protein [Arcicella sp. DC2W]